MNHLRQAAWAVCLSLSGAAFAAPVVYNISATQTPQNFVLTQLESANGFTLQNMLADSVLYTVTPVRAGETTGATFTAALRFGSATPPTQGWEWNYWLLIGDDLNNINYANAYQVGFGGGFGGVPGSPSNGANGGVPATGSGTYQSTALDAFNQAPVHSFVLAPGQFARLHWRDNNWGDNAGGISVSVASQPVPAPPSLALSLLALAVMGGVARRRRA